MPTIFFKKYKLKKIFASLSYKILYISFYIILLLTIFLIENIINK